MLKQLLNDNDRLYKTLVNYNLEASVLLLGSTSQLSGMPYNSRLSDIDLLCVPSPLSFQDYVTCLEKTFFLTEELNKNKSDIVDVFLLSSTVANLHFSYLSVLAGASEIDIKSAIVKASDSIRLFKSPTPAFCTQLYIAKSFDMISIAQEQFPIADSSHARKVAKELLRALKVTFCALNEGDLRSLENELMLINSFSGLERMMVSFPLGSMPHLSMLECILEGKDIEDWPVWMIAQEEIARWFEQLEAYMIKKLPRPNRRLYRGIVQVRDMLLLDLKDIFLQFDRSARLEMIQHYADAAAGVMVKLSIAGVPGIGDLTSTSTPVKVREAHDIIVSHLITPQPSLSCLAAAVILLEYALEQTTNLG